MTHRRVQALWGSLFLAPGTALILAFVVVPIALSAWISLHRWSMFTPITRMEWAALDNYAAILGDDDFLTALANTFAYSAISIALLVPLALGIGIFLYRPALRGRVLVRAILFSTYMIPTVAVALIWGYLYSPNYGPLNQLLGAVGLPRQGWLGSPDTAMLSLIVFNAWQTLGYYTVLVIAGLTQIPQDYYDSAALDGAGVVGQTRHITVPLLRRTLVFVVIITAINTLQVFDPVYVLTQGGPADATSVVAYRIFKTAFDFGAAGMASAMAIVLLGVLTVVVSVFLWATRERER